jgi:beta-hydroxylase
VSYDRVVRLDPSGVPWVPLLERRFEIFREESDALTREDYVRWPQQQAYTGDWLVFPLIVDPVILHPFLHVDVERNQRRCPRSTEVLRGIDGLIRAGFSRLEPGTHIAPHRDGTGPGVVRCQLALRIPAGCLLRVGAWTGTWQEGRCVAFNGLVEHEVANLGSEPRIVLLADFRPPPPPPS